MKQILIILVILLLLFFAFQCEEKKKPNNPDLENPGYYFPINFKYKWTYVLLNNQCKVGTDSFAIDSVAQKNREEMSGWESGWDLYSSGGGTTFVYRKGDTIFTREIPGTPLPSKVLVGPIQKGRYWKDLRGYEYYISGFEDIYSAAAGGTYYGCAKIERTSSGDPKKTYLWWAPQIGKVRREEKNQSDQCVSGEELRRLDKSPFFP
jgi:hypothetical protein